MNTMIGLCITLFLFLTAYSLIHYFCVLVFLRAKTRSRSFETYPSQSVALFIPSRNEGNVAMRAIKSALTQDHQGPLEIYLLLKDGSDSSMEFLRAAFPQVSDWEESNAPLKIYQEEHRKLFVAFTGVDAKSDKINKIAEQVNTDYVAILDSDHEAHPTWIRSSLILLQEKNSRIIQGRRGALATKSFFQLWDSLHQHIGCEIFNVAFTELHLTLFITGTTVVMETSLLKDNPLSESLTEDVELSYRILMQGEKCIYNPYFGSHEEVSPDMFSFIARRRRWANGHTGSFLHHVGKIGSAPLTNLDKFQFVFHGFHYLIALFVFVLHFDIGLILIQKMSPITRLVALIASLLLGRMIAGTQRSNGFITKLWELVIVVAWIFPAILILINFIMAFFIWDLGQAILPIPDYLQALGLLGLFAPLIVLLAGMYGFKQLHIGSLLWVVVTYPVAFYLDVTAVLIGLVDFITNKKYWHVVARAPMQQNSKFGKGDSHGHGTLGLKESLQLSSLLDGGVMNMKRLFASLMKPSRLIAWVLILGLLYLGGIYTPNLMLPVTPANCEVLQHDTDPWIVAPDKIPGYCTKSATGNLAGWSKRTGSYTPIHEDRFHTIDPKFWDTLDSTFFCNQAVFSPKNVKLLEGGGVLMLLKKETLGGKEYTTGSMASKENPEALFQYGRFEVKMKPSKISGVISAFFLYRFDPWQEIDMEFIGKDTTRILLNVYFNPGNPGDLYNYGYRGTPVLVDLGFDAAHDFHRYALEWDAEEIRWYVDDKLIHRRRDGFPTPIPHLPMRFYMNTWPTCSVELAGSFLPKEEPMGAEFQSVSIYKWKPNQLPWLSTLIDYLSPYSLEKGWRKDANWMQAPKPR